MYLATALKHAIPYAIEDRTSLADAYNQKGPAAEDALAAAKGLVKLKGIKPSRFTKEQAELARCALVWAEQNLSEVADCEHGPERNVAIKLRAQLKAVRLAHYGQTNFEVFKANAIAVDFKDAHALIEAGKVEPFSAERAQEILSKTA